MNIAVSFCSDDFWSQKMPIDKYSRFEIHTSKGKISIQLDKQDDGNYLLFLDSENRAGTKSNSVGCVELESLFNRGATLEQTK
jgi:hypothetical protein